MKTGTTTPEIAEVKAVGKDGGRGARPGDLEMSWVSTGF